MKHEARLSFLKSCSDHREPLKMNGSIGALNDSRPRQKIPPPLPATASPSPSRWLCGRERTSLLRFSPGSTFLCCIHSSSANRNYSKANS